MTGANDAVRDFFRRHRAAAVGTYLEQPELGGGDEEPGELVELDIETPPDR
jgi:hypothetical protein